MSRPSDPSESTAFPLDRIDARTVACLLCTAVLLVAGSVGSVTAVSSPATIDEGDSTRPWPEQRQADPSSVHDGASVRSAETLVGSTSAHTSPVTRPGRTDAGSYLQPDVGISPSGLAYTTDGASIRRHQAGGTVFEFDHGDSVGFDEASISGIVTDSQGTPIPDAVVWASEFTFGEEDQAPGTPGVQEETRFTIEPITPPGVTPPGRGEESAAYAEEVDDLEDDFLVSQLAFRNDTQPNVTGDQPGYVPVDNETVTARQLRNYTFGEFDAVEIETELEDGYTLYDRADDAENASYTLDPVPAIDAGDIETRYEITAVRVGADPAKDVDLGRRLTPGRASVLPQTTDHANVVAPIVDPLPGEVTIRSLDAPERIHAGDDATVTATLGANGNVPDSTSEVQYRVDIDGDGTLAPDEVITTEFVEVPDEGTVTVAFDIDAVALALSPGEYAHGVALPASESNATASVEVTRVEDDSTDGPPVDVELVPASPTVSPDGETRLDIRAAGVSEGVGSIDTSVRVTNPGVATIAEAAAVDATSGVAAVTDDGATVSVQAVGIETADTGTVPVASVTLVGESTGETAVELDVATVGDDAATEYDVESTENASVTVTTDSSDAPVIDGTTTTDPDGDGLYEDVTGDGAVSILDVGLFLDRMDDRAIRNDAAAFDFDGSGDITIRDVATLLTEV
jgi:hypothetical protein